MRRGQSQWWQSLAGTPSLTHRSQSTQSLEPNLDIKIFTCSMICLPREKNYFYINLDVTIFCLLPVGNFFKEFFTHLFDTYKTPNKNWAALHSLLLMAH